MDEVGSASGVLEAVQQLSTSLGVAVLGTIFFSAFGHHLAAGRAADHRLGLPGAAGGSLPARLPPADACTRRWAGLGSETGRFPASNQLSDGV